MISWYFHLKRPANGWNLEVERNSLNRMNVTDGMLYTIDWLHEFGFFAALSSWIDAGSTDPRVLIVRFEDLITENGESVFHQLFAHCDIRLPNMMVNELLDDYSFERLSGRKRGHENNLSHYRKGNIGDWKDYFDDRITAKFREVAGDLVEHLGYDEPPHASQV